MKMVYMVVVFVSTSVGVAVADDSLLKLTKKFSVCIDKSDGVTPSIFDCISPEKTTQDARLNGVYKKKPTQLTPKIKKQLPAAQPIRAEIATLDGDMRRVGISSILNYRYLSKISASKDLTRGVLTIDITSTCNGCGALPYLVRLFDRNGNYLSHFVAESFFESFGKDGYNSGRRHLEYSVNIRDLRDAEIIEFGFMPKPQ